MTRAALYNRVSTSQQDPERAREDLRQAAQHRGFEIVLDIAETGSGARNDRPGLQKILEAARRGQIDTVLVMRLDRFGRSAPDLLQNIRALKEAGVEFIALDQGLHVKPNGDAVSQLLLTILSGVAEFEREIIRDRVREGQRRAKKRGVTFGRPKEKGPSPDNVRRLREAGWTWAQIADRLQCSRGMAERRYAEAD